jgi:kelch-like protein 2/3
MVASDLKSKVFKLIKDKHQKIFDKEKNNKLYNIFPKVGDSIVNHRSYNRYLETKLTRLMIGHTRITHSYLLKGEPVPQCIGCATNFTVKHILLECVDFSLSRIEYFNTVFKNSLPKFRQLKFWHF